MPKNCQIRANSEDPNQMLHSAASDLGLYRLLYVHLNTWGIYGKITKNFMEKYKNCDICGAKVKIEKKLQLYIH